MKKLAPNLYYMDRAEWGEDTAIPRLGGPEDPRGPYPLVPRDTRVYAIFHHTVAIDNDASPSVWETTDEVKAQMKRLQTIRPDLGLDVPYNFVLFLMKDDRVIVCEGRGYDRWGAHTAGMDNQGRYFNGTGIATAFHADLENYNLLLSHWIPTINYWLGHLQQVLPNLGTVSPTIYPVAGHRDFSIFSPLNATACPGYYLYLRMGAFKFIPPLKEEEMAALDLMRVAGTFESLASDIHQGFQPNSVWCSEILALIGGGEEIAVTNRVVGTGLMMYAAGQALRGNTLSASAVKKVRYIVKQRPILA